MARSLRIPPRKKEDWVRRIKYDVDEAVNARSDWLEDCRRGMRTIRMIPPGEKIEPWVGPYSDDTEILTDQGWRLISGVSIGDRVLSRDPETGESAYDYVLSTYREEYPEMIHFLGKSIDMLVSPNHMMYVEKRGHAVWVPARHLRGHYWIPLTSSWKGEDREFIHGYDAGDYLEFLGWYIAEGCIHNGGTISLAQSDEANPENCTEIASLLDRLGFSYSKTPSTFLVHVRDMSQEIRDELASLGKSTEKHVPREYLFFGANLLSCLLRGLMGGDGSIQQRPGRNHPWQMYYTSSPQLAEDVQEIAQKVGLRGRVTNRGVRPTSKVSSYEVSICWKKAVQGLKLKPKRVPYGRMGYCVTVRHHTIYVRRNGIATWGGNCSNIITPHTMMQYEQNVRRLVMYFVANREYVSLVPNNAAVSASGSAQVNQDLLRWQAENQFDYWNFVDDLVRDFCACGTGIGFGGWIRDKSPVVEVAVLGKERLVEKSPGSGAPEYVQEGEKVRRDTPFDRIAREVFAAQNVEIGTNKIVKGGPKDLEVRKVRFKEKGRPWQVATITIDRAEELGEDIEVLSQRTKVVKDQPFWRALLPDRVLVPPGDHRVGEADFVSVKKWVTWEFIQKKMGKFNNRKEWDLSDEQMRQIQDVMVDMDDKAFVRQYHGASSESGEYYGEFSLRQDTDSYVGVDSEITRARKLPVLEMVRKWPILKKSDELCEARLIYLPTMEMLPWIHHEGAVGLPTMRSFVSHHFKKNRGQFYGTSLPRTMESIQEVADAFMNMELDSASITTNPVMLLDTTATIARDNLSYYPGATIRVGDASGVNVLQWPSKIGDFEAIQNRIGSMAQIVGRQSPESVGQESQRPQANRTARGAQIMLSEKNFNVAYDGESLVRTVTDVFKITHAYNGMNLPEGFEFRVLGTDEVKRVGREQVRGEFDFKFEAGQAVQNDEMRRQLKTEFAQLIAPLSQAQPEQVPEAIHNLYEDLGKAYGELNVARYLPEKIDGVGDSLSPNDEHKFFTLGRSVAVHPNDIDALHLEQHVVFAQSEAFDQMHRDMVGPFKQHVLEHHRRMQSARGSGQAFPGNTGVQVAGPLGLSQGGNPAVPAGPGQAPVGEPNRAANGSPLSSIAGLGG